MGRETYFDGHSYMALSSKVECVQALGAYEDILFDAEKKRRVTIERLTELVKAESEGRLEVKAGAQRQGGENDGK